MLMSDAQIKEALSKREIILDPPDFIKIEPASCDLSVGKRAFSSSSKDISFLSERGVLIIEPGEFAVIETRERVTLSAQIAGQIGLRSEYAQKGLLLLSGPQIDPGWPGILVVRVVNVAPRSIALTYQETFLTIQFFRLSQPVAKPYSGTRKGDGITAKDIQELAETEGMTLGQVMKTLTALAVDVGELRTSVQGLSTSVQRLSYSIPAIVALGLILIAIIVLLKP
jgi:deoxycytidine triphosphate deaminase